MPTAVADTGNGLSYISAHSADVILSDIRPIKLKPDALRAINVLLDEFLYKILSTSASLATDKLRASLLSLLPTSLGKEALLEAEVELRAYWERTDPKVPLEDDIRTFHLQWAFEFLRLKCEAYSTLNEQDEDPALEGRINERMGKIHPHPPKIALVDPAALYLTAIIESMCEHILSNVGRVAARDSSRTSATVNDLFVALCEDDSIYGFFRTMKVYEQIELISKAPKARRSKSISRNNDRLSTSRTSSPHHDLTLLHSSSGSGSRSRQSSEGNPPPSAMPSSLTSSSRTSFEKSRAIRMFTANSKGERDGESQSGHKKSGSMRSENSRAAGSFGEDNSEPIEDAAMLREFDDLMRSASTMKVSLTPDRLRTMEVYKQEKDQRNTTRRPAAHFSSNSEPDIPASRPGSQKPLGRVDSIVEDEENTSPKSRTRQTSVATLPAGPSIGVQSRTRSISTGAAVINLLSKPSRSPSVKAAPSAYSHTPATEIMIQSQPNKTPNNNRVSRTHHRQRNRGSLDLDDASDDDQKFSDQPVRSPQGSKKVNSPHAVSATTRELMEFLAEGPPTGPKVSKNGRELMDFLSEGPPDYSNSATSLDVSKAKGAGRLQRMISKLNIGNGEKVKGGADIPKTPSSKQFVPPVSRTPPTNHPKSSLASLANRPIPPRPRNISPPSSSQESLNEPKGIHATSRKPSSDATIPRDQSSVDKPYSEKLITVVPTSTPTPKPSSPLKKEVQEKPIIYSPPHITDTHGRISAPSLETVTPDLHPSVSGRRSSHTPSAQKLVPNTVVNQASSFSKTDVQDTERLLSSATTVDECRLIFEMFMARNGINKQQAYPSPPPSVIKPTPIHSQAGESSLENSLVELFLGDPSTSTTQQLADIEGLPFKPTMPSVATDLSASTTATL